MDARALGKKKLAQESRSDCGEIELRINFLILIEQEVFPRLYEWIKKSVNSSEIRVPEEEYEANTQTCRHGWKQLG